MQLTIIYRVEEEVVGGGAKELENSEGQQVEARYANPTCSCPASQGMHAATVAPVSRRERQMVGKVEVRDSHRDTNGNQDESADESATRHIGLHLV